jgi:hypothetical protein
MLIREIEEHNNVASTTGFTLREAIQLVINWCDANPERKLIKISWLFTLRAKHLAMALRAILGIIPAE